MEQTASEQKEIAKNQTLYTPHFKSYLKNLPIKYLTTMFRRNTSNQISIPETDQSTNTNQMMKSVCPACNNCCITKWSGQIFYW